MASCFVCGGQLPNVREYQNTCRKECHEALLDKMENDFGSVKRVTRLSTGVTYLVPTRYIAEHGIKEAELDRFPVEDET